MIGNSIPKSKPPIGNFEVSLVSLKKLRNDSFCILPVCENKNFKNKKITDKIIFDGIKEENISELKSPDYINMMKCAIENSDAIIKGSEELPEALEDFLKNLEKPVLKYHKIDEFAQPYLDFYNSEVLQ